MKRGLALILSMMLVMSFTLVGCGSNAPKEEGNEKEAAAQTNELAKEEGKEKSEEALKVALVVAGGLGDRSFYDSSNEGLEMIKKDFGVTGVVLECKNDPTLYTEQLIQASEMSDAIVVVGFEFYDVIQEVAKEFTDKKYIYIDNVVEGIDNITCIDYMENEGSFLAGALAAMMTESGKVGMVGGMDIPVIRNFQVGYEAGAKYVNPEIEVETIFAGDFEDPAKGKESALALYSKGVDIIFQVAGKTGEGVFEAGKDVNKFAIGVDSDQRFINPEVIVASMIKGVSLSIYESVERMEAGNFESGKVYKYGAKENGVRMSYGDESMKQLVSDEIQAKIQELNDKIIAGEIEVPEA